MNGEQRLKNIENQLHPDGRNRFGGEDILLWVRYTETMVTENGERIDVDLPAEYAEPDWDSVEPDCSGNRMLVQYPFPKSENGQTE